MSDSCCAAATGATCSPTCRPCSIRRRFLRLQKRVAEIHASDALLDYVQSIARASRDGSRHQAGLSPRAVIALLRSAQAWAFLHGHAGVLPEDLQAVLPAVVGHRLRLRDTSDAKSPVEVAAALLKSVPIP